MLIAPSKLIESEDQSFKGQCYYYTLLSSRNLQPSQILNEICSKLFKILKKVKFQEEGDVSVAIMENKFYFIIQKINPSLNLLIYYNLTDESIKHFLENAIVKIKWLSFGWITPQELDRFESYSEDFDVINLYTSFDPYYLQKRFAKIQPELQSRYQERWYKPRAIEVNIRIPKIDAHNFLQRYFPQKITETVKLKFKAKFGNPGEASIVVDQNAKVIHERGELKATDKIVSDVLQKTQSRISEYLKYSTSREYTKLKDGSFVLSDYTPSRPFFYSFKLPDGDMDEFSVKLENLLTVSRKNIPMYGIRLSRKGRDFSCLSYLPVDRSELQISYIEDSGTPRLIVDPLKTTPLGILTLTRTLSEKMTWSTEFGGFYEEA